MKKLIGFIIAAFIIVLSGCSNAETIFEERTIILEIEGDEKPTFSSNFGVGEYNETEKTYTHTIEYIKDLYIYVSAVNLKTQTVYVSTSEMKDSIIRKTVRLEEQLDAELEITIDGVDNLEGLEILSPSTYEDLIIRKENKFSLILPSRDEDYDIEFSLPEYKNFEIELSHEDIVSGIRKINLPAVLPNQVYIGFEGSDYEYSVYSTTTNEELSTGYMYNENNDIKYIILEDTDSYYVRINNYNMSTEELIEIPSNENYIIEVAETAKSYGYINVRSNDIPMITWMLYDKQNKKLSIGTTKYNSLENLAVVVQLVGENNNYDYYYCDNLSNLIIQEEDDGYQTTIRIGYSDLTKINLDYNLYHRETKELISEIEFEPYSNFVLEAELIEDTLYVKEYGINKGPLYLNVYDMNDNLLFTDEMYIGTNFNGQIYSNLRNINGKNIPYIVPIFADKLVYDGENYSYPKIKVDTEKALVRIYLKEDDKSNMFLPVNTYGNPFLVDSETNVIVPTDISGIAYFEIEPNKEYTLNYNKNTYIINATEEEISTGNIYLLDEEYQITKIKVPKGYYIIDFAFNTEFYPNEEGIVYLPTKSNTINGLLYNSYVGREITIELDGSEVYTLNAFITLSTNNSTLQYAGEYNGLSYCYHYNEEDFGIDIMTNHDYYTLIGEREYTVEPYTISFENFVYNEETQSYHCDFESLFGKVLYIESYYDYIIEKTNYVNTWDFYYLPDGAKLYIEGVEYDLSIYESKYLKIAVNDKDFSLIITEVESIEELYELRG